MDLTQDNSTNLDLGSIRFSPLRIEVNSMDQPNLPKTGNEPSIKMFVLDVLRYDIEQIESIVKLLNDEGCIGWRDQWTRDFTTTDVVEVMPELVREGYVDLYAYSDNQKSLVPLGPTGYLPNNYAGNEESYWYLLTDKGRALWESWEPPGADDCTS